MIHSVIFTLSLLTVFGGAVQFTFNLPHQTRKCFSQRIPASTLIVASASIDVGGSTKKPEDVQGAGLVLRISYAKSIFNQHWAQSLLSAGESAPAKGSADDQIIFEESHKSSIKTAFTSIEAGEYLFCVSNLQQKRVGANLDSKSSAHSVVLRVDYGPEAKDYSQVAKKEHLDEVALGLRKVEDQLRDYHKNLLLMKTSAQSMRKISQSTSSMLLLFGCLTVAAMIIAAVAQIVYFRNFLRSRKII